MDFIPSQTPVPVSGGAVGNEFTVPFLIVLGLAVAVTVAVFRWSNRTRT